MKKIIDLITKCGLKYFLSLFFIVGLAGNSKAQQLAFPTAEGFGAYAKGGRGGDVYHVTNLNDAGSGSLRYGINSASGPRTIVFDVSGMIELEARLDISGDYMTVAGQTAPGDGICVKNYPLNIGGNHNIVRYMRSRLGVDRSQEDDAMGMSGHNNIADHCSSSWSVDECFSASTDTQGQIDSVTVQWCVISEALANSIHSKGSHSYGALIRGCYGAKYSYLHNLFAHNASRNPRPGNYDTNPKSADPEGLQFDYRNNVMYNWGGNRPGYDADAESVCRYNYVNNYGKTGPNSNSSGYAYDPGCKHFRAYYSGNYFYGQVPSDQWSLLNWTGFSGSEQADYKMSTPYSTGPVTTLTAQEAYNAVIDHVGASYARDAVDTRVINEMINGTGSIIDFPSDVGGYPTYSSIAPQADTDQDGMPDLWETARGLNINDASDRNGDDDSDGYTNLEEYLNSIAGSAPLATYTLTVNSGTGDADCFESAIVNIDADVPGQGSTFDQWTGDVANVADVNDPNTTISMPAADVTITATYKAATTYTLTVNRGTGDGFYVESQVIPIVADAPPQDSLFSHWAGDVSGVANVYDPSSTITMSAANATITATYVNPASFSVTEDSYIKEAAGNFGSDIELRVKQSAGFHRKALVKFDLTGAGLGTETISQAYLKLFAFSAEPTFLTALELGDGWSEGSVTWDNAPNAGSIISTTAISSAGNYYLWDVTSYVQAQVADDEIVSIMLDDLYAKFLDVKFNSKEAGSNIPELLIVSSSGYPLTVNSGTGDGSYEEATVVAIAADALAGYAFDAWTGDVANVADVNAANTSITMPAAPTGITATYVAIPYTLTVTNGTGDGNYTIGTVVAIDADVAPQDSVFDAWIGDVTNVADINNSSTTITMPAAAASVTATYKYVLQGSGTYAVTADSYIRGGSYADDNYGSVTSLQNRAAKGSAKSLRYTIFKFDLTQAGLGTISDATLRVYANTVGSNVTISVMEYSDSWLENTITWNNAPTEGSVIGTIPFTTAGSYYEVDVTSYVQQEINGDEIVSFYLRDLTKGGSDVEFDSKEGVNSAELVINATSMKSADAILISQSNTLQLGAYPNPFSGNTLQLGAYPNPFSGNTTIQFTLENSSNVNVDVFDLSGSKVLTLNKMFYTAGSHELTLSRDNLEFGMYILRMSTANTSGLIKLIVK